MPKLPMEYRTLEDAVAHLINFDYIPAGFSLLDMTTAFLEEADVQLHNAQIDGAHDTELAGMRSRFDVCQARHSLAVNLLEYLKQETQKPDTLIVTGHDDGTGKTLVTLDSVANWSNQQFGLALPDWSINERIDRILDHGREPRWEDVTVKIYADYRIGYKVADERFNYSSFREIGLMGARKHEPNKLGGILIRLSLGNKFPVGKSPDAKDKTSLSYLRSALTNLIKIASDPFYAFNEGDGWKPRFALIDDRRNADERAKKRATYTGLEGYDQAPEVPDFELENDTAQAWLKENQR